MAKYKIIIVFLLIFQALTLISQETEYDFQANIHYYNDSINNSDDYISERCVLDIYYPKNLESFPTVIWFHGGGLQRGEKYIPHGLKNQNICIVAVNYRLSPQIKCPAYLRDCAAAIAWVFNTLENYGGDTSAIFLSGHSAGGYLTCMLGLDKKWLNEFGIDANNIAGLIAFSGQTITHSAIRKERGIPRTQVVVDQYAPLYHARPDAPPLLLITGGRSTDNPGRYEENALLCRMMKFAGHTETKQNELEGYGHGDMIYPAVPLLINEIKRIVNSQGCGN